MLAIWRSLERFRFDSSFRTWAIGIVKRKIADYFRSRYRAQVVPISELAEIGDGTQVDDRIESIDIQQAIRTLSQTEQELLFLVFTAQFTYPEVSKVMQIPVGTVKSKMSSVKEKLRHKLQEGG